MIALVIALVVVTLLGPAAGYFFASRKLRHGEGARDLRVRQLEDELRRVRGGPAWAQQSGIPSAPPMPSGTAPNPFGRPQQNGPQQRSAPQRRNAPQQPGGPRQQNPAPPQNQPQNPAQGQPRRTMTPGERFAQEPPLFGDGASSGAPPSVSPQAQPQLQPQYPTTVPNPQHPASRHHPALPPHPGQQPGPQQQLPPAQQPAPAQPQPRPAQPAGPEIPPPPSVGDETATRTPEPEAPTGSVKDATERPAPDPRAYSSVSDIIDQADAAKLDWLGHVSAGRRVRLQRLGYDVPEKLANLRRSEIRRLSRELSVSEDVIRNEWVPAAEAFLRDRQA